MLNQFMTSGEMLLSAVLSHLKASINDYCDLETSTNGALVAKDGSMATVLRYDGFRSLMGKAEFDHLTDELAAQLRGFMGSRGHQIQVVFIRDDDVHDEVARYLAPMRETAEALGFDMADLLDEKQEVMSHYCMFEAVYFVLWTRPSVLDPVELKMSKAETSDIIRKYKLPSMINAQSPLRPIRFLLDRHESFVSTVVLEIERLKGAISRVDVHSALCNAKRIIDTNTPLSWKPQLEGDDRVFMWKERRAPRDISECMHRRIDDQLFGAPSVNGNRKGIGGVSDTKACRIGNRLFGPMQMKVPPQRIMTFSTLFSTLNNLGVTNADGRTRPIPWVLSFMIEGDGLKGLMFREIFAGILKMAGKENNGNIVAACSALKRYQNSSHGGAVVKMQCVAMTWVDYHTPNCEQQLALRRSKLSRALQGWGNCTVEEELGDPTAGVFSCIPGLSMSSVARASAPPLADLARMLPISRPASPFSRATSLLRTLDGKLMPWEVFSDSQSTWLTLIFGGPGSGKSVWANRLNEEMCLLGGLKRLPYICVVDIDISSAGFVSLIEDVMPPDLRAKGLAVYKRVQNTEAYRVNPFDTQLGCRKPLPSERAFMINQLLLLATPPARLEASSHPHRYMDAFVAGVIDKAFDALSDKVPGGRPKEAQLAVNSVIEKKARELDLPVHEATTWWEVVDMFSTRGYYYEAAVAQRYAVPTLFDIMTIAASLQEDFKSAVDDMPVFDEFKIMMDTVATNFPIFYGHTQYDIGESRIMAIDLQDVVSQGSVAAKRQSALMYMMAINAFMRKVNICKEDLELIDPVYFNFHKRRVEELAEDYKRLFIDEYHKTGGLDALRNAVLIFGRESRKWNLEVVLASQLPQDFDGMAELATSIVILDSGNEQTRGRIKRIFGLSDVEVIALKNNVNGAKPGIGATFLAKLKTKDAELSQLFTATSGGIEMWGLTTTAEDRALRSRLYDNMSKPVARMILNERFPRGSCKAYVLDQKQKVKSEIGDVSFIDSDAENTVIDKLFKELMDRYYQLREQGKIMVEA